MGSITSNLLINGTANSFLERVSSGCEIFIVILKVYALICHRKKER